MTNGFAAVTGRPRVTLRDVAQDAGVSRATASLVVRGSPAVADETRRRVLASMDKLGYVYDRGAASLRTGRSRTVGLIVTDVTNPFFAEVTVGIEAELDEANMLVMLANTSESLEKQHRLLAAMREGGVDGVLICPAQGTSPSLVDPLSRARLPLVLLVRYLYGADNDYVGADNALGAELAIEHLIAHGHRRIAFIGGPPGSSARRDRLTGYRDALARHDVSCDISLLPASAPTRQGGHAAMLTLLSGPRPPTAVLCYNDVVAFGAMLAVRARGLTPGHDVAVIGFDDIAEAAISNPPLTTVAIGPRDIGAAAARLLLERIADPNGAHRQVVLRPKLVVRESCGCHGAASEV